MSRTLRPLEGSRWCSSPWSPAADAFLSGMVRSASRQELAAATRHPMFDFSPPTDERPFFFNTLKPASFYQINNVAAEGVIAGNLRATVHARAAVPDRAGAGRRDHRLSARAIRSAGDGRWQLCAVGLYFALIGLGFMLIQIPFLQRFSVYLGHPTYTFAVILFSMILFTGIGSFLSDRFPIDRHRWVLKLPIVIGLMAFAMTLVIQPLMDATIHLGLPARSLMVVACTAPFACSSDSVSRSG